jgi:hypothetical protein
MPANQEHVSANNALKIRNGMYSDDIQSMMQDLLRTLANLDFQHEDELDKLERSATDEELKKYIKEKILARHRERREPYVDLLAELHRQQYKLSFVA